MSSKDGGAAFPRMSHTNCHGLLLEEQDGMKLHDWFAGQALKGLLANPWIVQQPGFDRDGAVGEALAYADAMLKAKGEPR